MEPYQHRQLKESLLHSYGDWVYSHTTNGWKSHLLTFKFSQIPGSNASKLSEMKKSLTWFYGRLAKASVPKPSSQKWSQFLPKVILTPDLPVPKRSLQKLKDVTINNGIHWHGLALINPLTPKLALPLHLHIEINLAKFMVRSIIDIHVEPIIHTPRPVTQYGKKGIKKIEFEYEDVLIFPRCVSELPTSQQVKGIKPCSLKYKETQY